MRFPHFKNELKYIGEGYDFVAGCDEVGVSPLAGPVVAAACILDPESVGRYRTKSKWYYRVRDSKTTNESERQILLKEILEHTVAYGVGVVWHEEIDALNIHHASLKAMRLANEELLQKIEKIKNTDIKSPQKILLFIDGRFKIPNLPVDQKTVVAGDSEILSISAASIIAKVHRDNIMRELDSKFPEYGFKNHKGYNTREHQEAIKKFGATPFHRRSFFQKGWLRDVQGFKNTEKERAS
jgi:ribonuclease HII